jgi:hypothetical protein
MFSRLAPRRSRAREERREAYTPRDANPDVVTVVVARVVATRCAVPSFSNSF